MSSFRVVALTLLAGVCTVAVTLALGQLAGTRRFDVLRHDLPIPGREVVQSRVEIDPGVTSARHWHPGEEIAFVLEGTLEYRLEGKAPVTLKAGEALFIPANTPHTAKNVGTGKAAELATYLVDKNKPLSVVVQ